jgi:UrcA family protein
MNAVTAKSPRARAALYTVITACVAIGTCAAVQAGESCATAPQSAHAANAANAVTVSYHDLDLSTREGASVLYARINHAAHEVCDAGNSRDLYTLAAAHACERSAVAQAVRAVDNPQLAALVAVKMPQG